MSNPINTPMKMPPAIVTPIDIILLISKVYQQRLFLSWGILQSFSWVYMTEYSHDNVININTPQISLQPQSLQLKGIILTIVALITIMTGILFLKVMTITYQPKNHSTLNS
jgi:hypothetical protein